MSCPVRGRAWRLRRRDGWRQAGQQAGSACRAEAQRQYITVQGTGQSAAQAVPNGMRLGFQLKQGNDLYPASCFYETRSGQAPIEQDRPQPR